MIHITKDGKKIQLSDLTTEHLENIIRRIERKAFEGITVDSECDYPEEI